MEKYITFKELMTKLGLYKKDIDMLQEIIRLLIERKRWEIISTSDVQELLFSEEQEEVIIAEYQRNEKRHREFYIKNILNSIKESMSDEQKYKVIFDWFVRKCKYDYSILEDTKALHYAKESSSRYRKIIRGYIAQIENYQNKSRLEQLENLIELLQRAEENKELIDLMKKERICLENSENFRKNAERYREGDIFATHYGVCEDFAKAYKEICDGVGLKCEIIIGHIFSDQVECGHAWNAITVSGTVKYVDISGAIHSKDGTIPDTQPDDFFNVFEQQLEKIDNGKGRKITDESKVKILNLQNTVSNQAQLFD